MIVGIGHDIADMDRIEKILSGHTSKRFMERILTKNELELAMRYEGKRLVQFVSGRFAAKEAVVKAIGCGIGDKVGFGDIDIMPDVTGKPGCSLSDEAWRRIDRSPEAERIHVTISHDRSIASAVAVMERLG
ncbi:holo-ACP synthase [Paenibacillus thailandensis]|uniref:Holo-[acyl-carrier-protein] synthase n=1 Tax=Paenibacillus thailandensis TaxID=393250 RepID=A0ABW5QZY2_9BACL